MAPAKVLSRLEAFPAPALPVDEKLGQGAG